MNKYSLLLFFTALLCLSSCKKATYINPDKTFISFPKDGGTQTITITADGSWNVNAPDWVTTKKEDGQLTCTVATNDTGDKREGPLTLSSGDVITVIAVKQGFQCTYITPESTDVSFEKEGGTQTVNVDTDGDFTVESGNVFNASYNNGVLTITADANDGGKKNEEIRLVSESGITASIDVSQAGNICPRCNGRGQITCPKCHGRGNFGSNPNCGGMAECEYCGGHNDCSEAEYSGTGKVTCPECGGTGK